MTDKHIFNNLMKSLNVCVCVPYPWDLVRRASSSRFSCALMCMMPGVSNFCLIQLHCSNELMNMNSTPEGQGWNKYNKTQ